MSAKKSSEGNRRKIGEATSNNNASCIVEDELMKDYSKKEILINQKDIEEFGNAIVKLKEEADHYKKRVDTLEEMFTKYFSSKVNELEYIYDERKLRTNLKLQKSASKSEASSSKSSKIINKNKENQKSILNLGFVTTIRVPGKSMKKEKMENEKENEHQNNIQPVVEIENENISKIDVIPDRKSFADKKGSEEKSNNSETNQKTKKVDMLDDKQVNYNQKFFDYKSFHSNKEKEKEMANQKRIHEGNEEVNQKRSKKNDWIRKELNNINKKNNDSKVIDLTDNSEHSDTSSNILNNNVSGIKKVFPNPFSDKNLNVTNSSKKSEDSKLSLDLDSNLSNKDKNLNLNLTCNFNNISLIENKPEEGKNKTKFAEFLKLKKEKNISVNRLNRINEDPIMERSREEEPKNNNYALDLHTLEETYSEFYDLKPKLKKNPFIPKEIKNRPYKNINTPDNRMSYEGNGRNKKDREKMNGYKCEICEQFYEILGEKSDSICQTCSRHRTSEDPNRTPKGFYEMSI